jgi:hypothetical protein
MADDHRRRPSMKIRAGEVLLWRINGSDAESKALRMGDTADLMELGDWAISPIVLGTSYWFELVPGYDIDMVHVILAFGCTPTAHY